jgi:hypothetical protein
MGKVFIHEVPPPPSDERPGLSDMMIGLGVSSLSGCVGGGLAVILAAWPGGCG